MRQVSVVAAVIALALATGIASAAPLPARGWAGWYAGFNAGGNLGGDSVSTSASNSEYCGSCAHSLDFANASIEGATGSFPGRTDGFIGGAQLGYNWQIANRWFAGFEADVQGLAGAGKSSATSASSDVPNFAGHSVATDLSISKRIDFLGTVRGRLGYLIEPRLLVFGTGGFAYGHVKSSLAISQNLTGSGLGAIETSIGTTSSISRMLGGWTLGSGFEWLFAPNWSAKVEYLYYDLGKATATGQISDVLLTGPLAGTNYFVNNVQSTTRFNGSIVRVGVNYRF